ncbi:MAG: hypothetical protein KGI29_00330 [Pseudomonadota bacterium]|nr:hypothetical protein [Pseudomonadota bacterium]MDE3038501.1 hypothetical protein [Pseudomonadota bacterium]
MPAEKKSAPAAITPADDNDQDGKSNPVSNNMVSGMLALAAGAIAFFAGGEVIGLIGALIIAAIAFFIGSALGLDKGGFFASKPVAPAAPPTPDTPAAAPAAATEATTAAADKAAADKAAADKAAAAKAAADKAAADKAAADKAAADKAAADKAAAAKAAAAKAAADKAAADKAAADKAAAAKAAADKAAADKAAADYDDARNIKLTNPEGSVRRLVTFNVPDNNGNVIATITGQVSGVSGGLQFTPQTVQTPLTASTDKPVVEAIGYKHAIKIGEDNILHIENANIKEQFAGMIRVINNTAVKQREHEQKVSNDEREAQERQDRADYIAILKQQPEWTNIVTTPIPKTTSTTVDFDVKFVFKDTIKEYHVSATHEGKSHQLKINNVSHHERNIITDPLYINCPNGLSDVNPQNTKLTNMFQKLAAQEEENAKTAAAAKTAAPAAAAKAAAAAAPAKPPETAVNDGDKQLSDEFLNSFKTRLYKPRFASENTAPATGSTEKKNNGASTPSPDLNMIMTALSRPVTIMPLPQLIQGVGAGVTSAVQLAWEQVSAGSSQTPAGSPTVKNPPGNKKSPPPHTP